MNRAHVRDYPARERALLLEELRKSARELSDFLRSLDAEVFRRDHGVRQRGETVTIRGTVQELIVDYRHHLEQIRDLK